MKKATLLVLLLVTVMSVTGCETLKGAGEDIENTGQNIQEFFTKN